MQIEHYEMARDLDELMDVIYVSDRELELASGGAGDLMMSGSSNPGVNCSGGCK